MPVPSKPFTFSDTPPATNLIKASEINADFDALYNTLNPAVVGIDFTNTQPSPALLATQQAWQTVALGGILSGSLSYMKDSLGFVHVRGDGFVTSGAAPSAVATFPVGFRPVSTQGFSMGISGGGNPGTCTITTAGVLTITSGGSGFTVYFGSVSFRAEN